MSFHHGGMRFKGGMPRQSDDFDDTGPTNSSISEQAHPLRQNGVDTMMHGNPKSYASRAHGRPDLSLDTSPTFPPDVSRFSVDSAADSANFQGPPNPQRRESVPDRSPLQKLELTLGDISKEEKRARAQEAEQAYRHRKALAAGVTSTGARRRSSEVARDYARKHLPSSSVDSSRTGSRRYSSNPVAYPGPTPSASVRQSSAGYDSVTSKERRYGHNVALSGGAAAAAVDAYQLSRRRPVEASNKAAAMSPNLLPQDSAPAAPPRQAASAPLRTGDRTASEAPRTEPAQSTSPVPNQALESPPAGPLQSPPVDQDGEPAFFTPPQTAQGQRASQADASTPVRPESQQQRGSVRFSGLDHPQSEDKGRRYQSSQSLDEWRTAATATLTAEDLDLENEAPHKAWWEQSASDRTKSQKQTAVGASLADPAIDDPFKTTFQPELLLKCGPLLRYTGMRGDKPGSSGTDKSFWRGSVMIVTEDAISSYDPAPTLRIFAQPMKLLPKIPPGQFARTDPVGHLPTCSPTGQTMFVRPSNVLIPGADLSRKEGADGLFTYNVGGADAGKPFARLTTRDGEKVGRFKEVKGHRLHTERGSTFWRFNVEVELGASQNRIAYRINRGPAIGFWVPAKDQPMNIMFHSGNGFGLNVDPNRLSGPDPLWRDVLSSHQQRPFHVMLGGGDQIFNDAAMRETRHFKDWVETTNSEQKAKAPFTKAVQDELEAYYFNRYAMWFSQGLFGMANSQIPMVNIWDDHDIIDGFGSYPHHVMTSPIFSGLGGVAFKYYMLFQHQSLPAETPQDEPSWVLGASRGPYIDEFSRHVFMFLGKGVAFLGLDCRTERMREEVLSDQSYHLAFDRLDREIVKGETKHLIVLLGVPISYPRMNFAETILTSRASDPVKALARAGVFGGLVNKFDGGVEVLDNLDDHWTARHHREERSWLVESLQDFAADKSVRITILSGDVHMGAVGQFYSKRKFGVPKDRDNRYIPNVISSAIVNMPTPDSLGDFLNKRTRVHHFDQHTDEEMIPLFSYDVDGRDRSNHHLMSRRNWCSIRPYNGDITPPASPVIAAEEPEPVRPRSFSLTRRNSSRSYNSGEKPGLLRRLSNRVAPPSSFKSTANNQSQAPYANGGVDNRKWRSNEETNVTAPPTVSQPFHRRPSNSGDSAWKMDSTGREGHIDLQGGLEVTLNCEVNARNPSGATMPYRMIIPALFYTGEPVEEPVREKGRISGLIGSIRRGRSGKRMTWEDSEVVAQPPQPSSQMTAAPEAMAGAAAGAALGSAAMSSQAPQRAPAASMNGPETFGHLPRDAGPVETEVPHEVAERFAQMQQEQSQQRAPQSAQQDAMRRSASAREPAQQAFQSEQQKTGVERSNTVAGAEPPKPPATDLRRGVSRRSYADPFAYLAKAEAKPAARGVRVSNYHPSNYTPSQSSAPSATPTASAPSDSTQTAVPSAPTQDRRSTGPPASTKVQQLTGAPVGQTRQSEPPAAPNGRAGSRSVPSSAPPTAKKEKDPYARYYPEAVEAEWEAEHEHDGEDGEEEEEEDSDAPFDFSDDSLPTQTGPAPNHRAALSSRHSQQSYDRPVSSDRPTSSRQSAEPQRRGLYERSIGSDRSPSPPPMPRPQRNAGANANANAGARRQSKLERLTGEGGVRDSYASGGSMGLPQALASDKAASRLGVQPEELARPQAQYRGQDGAGDQRNDFARSNSTKQGGRGPFGGLMRRLSETKAGKKIGGMA